MAIGTILMGAELNIMKGILQYFRATEVKMNSYMVRSFMAQFVFGIDILHWKEVYSAVSYLMLTVSTRISMSTFVSYQPDH